MEPSSRSPRLLQIFLCISLSKWWKRPAPVMFYSQSVMPSLIVRLRWPVGKNTTRQDDETRFNRRGGTSAEREGHQVDVLLPNSRRRKVSESFQRGIHPHDDRHPQGVR